MSQILSRVTKPVRRKGAERNLQLNLLSFAASVSFTRLFLWITGYPQLGNETLHIAHVLYGGVFLYISSLIPLIYANRWAYTLTSVISGIGVGLFIDEVGKFITQNNDYFFPAAAPIIYAFFLTSVLLYRRVTNEIPFDTRTELYAVLESLEEAIDHEMDEEEHSELRERLGRIKEKSKDSDLGILSDNILEFVNSDAIRIVPDEPSFYDRTIDRFTDFERKWLSRKKLKVFLILGVIIMGLAASIRLVFYMNVIGDPIAFKALLIERITKLPDITSMSLFWASIQMGLEGVVGLILILSGILLILDRERIGLTIGSIGLLIYLVGVSTIQFYIDQFSTVFKALILFIVLQTLYYYQRRFRIK
jgi:hypothetical protein